MCLGHACLLAAQAPSIVSRYMETGKVLVDFPTIVVVTGTYAAVVLALKYAASKAAVVAKDGPASAAKPLFNTAPAMTVYNLYMSVLSLLMAVGFAVDFVNLGTWRWNQVRPAHPAGAFTAFTLWGKSVVSSSLSSLLGVAILRPHMGWLPPSTVISHRVHLSVFGVQ